MAPNKQILVNFGKQTGQLSQSILNFLTQAGAAFLYIIVDAMDYPWGRRRSQQSRYYSVYQSVRRLEKRGLVEVSLERRRMRIAPTDLGYRFAQRMAILSLRLEPQKIWDQRWRLVIFDIPESHKLVREVLRNTLRGLGFSQLQKSVFVTPWPCKKVIVEIQKIYFAHHYIRYIEATTFDGEDSYRKHYQLIY